MGAEQTLLSDLHGRDVELLGDLVEHPELCDQRCDCGSARLDLCLVATIAAKEAEIAKLQAKLDNTETEKKLAHSEAVSRAEKERDELAFALKSKDNELQLQAATIKNDYDLA